MVRKTLGITTVESEFDFDSLVDPGITLLKFGKQGKCGICIDVYLLNLLDKLLYNYKGIPHERFFTLSGNLRYLQWSSGWIPKLGFVNESKQVIKK